MSRYLQKYVGTYRVVAHYDKLTNDFPRIIHNDGSRTLDSSFDDLYIPCSGGSQIVHQYRTTMIAVLKSRKKGMNFLKKLYEEITKEDTKKLDLETITSYLYKNNYISKIEDTDAEYFVYFNDKDMELFTKVLGAKTSGAGISPFSPKNLPKGEYTIPESDLLEYKSILESLDNKLIIGRIGKEFLDKLDFDYKYEMKLESLKTKEYLHKIGLWNEYIEFLKEKLV